MKRKVFTIVAVLVTATAYAALESGTYISDLVVSNPTGSDPFSQGANHIRLVKSTIKNTFPNINGAVTASDEILNDVPVKSSTNTFTAINTFTATPFVDLNGAGAGLALVAGPTTTGDAQWLQWYATDATTQRAWVGFGNNGNNSFNITNMLSGGPIHLDTAGGSVLIDGGTAWHSGNDGSTSGLDADLLDGISSATFARQDTANSFANGQRVGTTPGSGYLIVNGGGATQTGYIEFYTTDNTRRGYMGYGSGPNLLFQSEAGWNYMFNQAPTVNGSVMWAASNDGAGTGLDADLLDGLSSGSFAAASHAHSGSDITSGTVAEARGGTGNSGGVARNVSAKAGTAKTFSTSAPSGGSDGDIWYRY